MVHTFLVRAYPLVINTAHDEHAIAVGTDSVDFFHIGSAASHARPAEKPNFRDHVAVNSPEEVEAAHQDGHSPHHTRHTSAITYTDGETA